VGATRTAIESAANSLRETLKGDDGDAIKKALEGLQQASYKLAEEMYKSSAPGAGPAAGTTPGDAGPQAGGPQASTKKDDDVIDAEYTEEKGDR